MDDDPKPIPESSRFTRLWKELRRRHVVRVAITYAVVAWLINQIAASTESWANLAICYALQDNSEEAESTIVKDCELTGTEYWKYKLQMGCDLLIAIAYLVLGAHDKDIENLEAAREMDGPILLNHEMDLWFIFDRLRGNPRFEALLKGYHAWAIQ